MKSQVTAKTRVCREDLIKLAGGGTAAITVGPSVIPFKESQAYIQGQWDHEADVIVVGSGAAALSAALAAAEGGASVLILEKATIIGGTTVKSGGSYWIANNSLMRTSGIEDPRPDAIKYMARLAYPEMYDPDASRFGLPPREYDLIAAFYDNGAAVLDVLAAMGALESVANRSFDGQLIPDYFAHLPENKAPRGRSLAPKRADGSRGQGAELIGQLSAAISQRCIPMLLGHGAKRLVVNHRGEVVGLEATTSGIQPTVAVRARQAVIFGSGGFTHNAEQRANFLPTPIYSGCAPTTNEGDLLTMAQGLGVKLANMKDAWFMQYPLEDVLQFSSAPCSAFYNPGDSMIAVNKYGDRVANEKSTYNERTRVHFEWDPVAGEYPNLLLFYLYDQRTADLFGGSFPIPPPGACAPYVIAGQSLEDLAKTIDARLDGLTERTGAPGLDSQFVMNLQETFRPFIQYDETGLDQEFHRGELPIELYFNGPRSADNDKPNPTMYPISSSGPYYAVILCPGVHDTKGGPKTNERAQILDADGRPIPGLYGAGNCTGSVTGQAHWGEGGTIGPALIFGFIAGQQAAREPVKGESVEEGSESLNSTLPDHAPEYAVCWPETVFQKN